MRYALIFTALMAAPCSAATFVGEAWMEFQAANGTLPRIPVEVVLTTDYSSIDWEISWDVPAATVVGGPDENFETRFGTRGWVKPSEPINLGFPNSSGTVSGTGRGFAFDIDYFGSTRVVSREEEWFGNRAVSNIQNGFLESISLNVVGYPDYLDISGSARPAISVSATTDGGNSTSMTGAIFQNETGSQRGFADSFTEVLPGDFNSDDLVDAADYTIARDVPTVLAALLTSDQVWRDNYGSSEAGQGGTPVPEPTSVGVALLCIASAAAGSLSRS